MILVGKPYTFLRDDVDVRRTVLVIRFCHYVTVYETVVCHTHGRIKGALAGTVSPGPLSSTEII